MTIPAGRLHGARDALVGLVYFAVGITTGTLAGAAATSQRQFSWRLAAFIISALVFAAHMGHEHFRLRHSARQTAWHASVAVALGAFGLALVANIHDLGSASGYRPLMLIALVAWPLGTAVPAFIVALVVAAVLGRWVRRSLGP
jgi:hypothetical protein